MSTSLPAATIRTPGGALPIPTADTTTAAMHIRRRQAKELDPGSRILRSQSQAAISTPKAAAAAEKAHVSAVVWDARVVTGHAPTTTSSTRTKVPG